MSISGVCDGSLRPPLDASWPALVCTLMKWCWCPDPSGRPSASQVLSCLHFPSLLDDGSGDPPPPPPPKTAATSCQSQHQHGGGPIFGRHTTDDKPSALSLLMQDVRARTPSPLHRLGSRGVQSRPLSPLSPSVCCSLFLPRPMPIFFSSQPAWAFIRIDETTFLSPFHFNPHTLGCCTDPASSRGTQLCCHFPDRSRQHSAKYWAHPPASHREKRAFSSRARGLTRPACCRPNVSARPAT